VAEAVPFGPVSAGIFPAKQGKEQGIWRKSTSKIDSDVICVGDFNRLRANSPRDETGNFFRGTGNSLDRTGKRRE
jgi:hypothetical protein